METFIMRKQEWLYQPQKKMISEELLPQIKGKGLTHQGDITVLTA